MIGMNWFLIVLFWCSFIIFLLRKLKCVEIFGLVYLILWGLQIKGVVSVPGNSNLFLTASVFMHMKYVLMGHMIGKYKDFFMQDKLSILWNIIGILGVFGFLYKGILYYDYMLGTNASVGYFASYYMDFIIVWIVLWALRHPMENMRPFIGRFMENTAVLLFFAQRIVIDLARILYKRVLPSETLSWGKTYCIVFLIICVMGIALTLLKRNDSIKKVCYWLV